MTIVFAIALSLDAMALGFNLGIKRMKLSLMAYILLFLASFAIMALAMFIGELINLWLRDISEGIGAVGIIAIGIFMVFNANDLVEIPKPKRGVLQPLFIAFILSIDSMAAGVMAQAMGLGLYLALLVAFCQAAFLFIGTKAAALAHKRGLINKKWNILAGFVLIFMGALNLYSIIAHNML